MQAPEPLVLFDRMDPSELTAVQLAPLEALVPANWPDQWREFAVSLFITLLSPPGTEAVPADALARLALALALGLAADHGGSQPYIPTGAMLAASSKARRVIALREQGLSYREVAVATGLSEADLDAMAASYNPALREAPLTVGHPKDNLPAYGWVKSVARNAAGVLAIDTHSVEPQFAEMVAARRFAKRSASFYPPYAPNNPTPGTWYLRHVAFLGAQPPAIAGLKDIAFSEADGAGGVVSFSEPLTAELVPTQPLPEEIEAMSKELQDQLAKAQADLKAAQDATTVAQADAAAAQQAAQAAQAQAASFAEKARADRKAGFVSFAQAQVSAGRLLPKDTTMAVAALDALADAQPVEFSEGDSTRKVSPAQWLQDLIATARPAVSFGEFAPGNTQQAQPGSARGKSDAEIDQAAKAFMHQHKVDYAEALGVVTASFTA